MTKKLIVVCYTFPPFEGIGGRRWAKFCKYLHRRGTDLKVIAARKQGKSVSAWTGDVAAYKDRVQYLDSHFPHALGIIPRNAMEKIRYRLALGYVKLRAKGNYYDQSVFWGKELESAVEACILQGYNNVIVSTAPFRSAVFLLELIQKYPAVNFMVDFRDPWTRNRTGYGFENLAAPRQAYELQCELEVIKGYNKVFAVAAEMNDYFAGLDPGHRDKFVLLPNGFDAEDIPADLQRLKQTEVMKLVFTGTFYDKSLHIFRELCESIREIKRNGEEWIGNIRFEFYGTVPAAFFAYAKGLDNIRYMGKLDTGAVYTKLAEASAGMLFLADDTNYSLSTKFHEYAGMKLPIIVFSKEGETGRLVEMQGIGLAIFSGSMQASLKKMYDLWSRELLTFNEDFQPGQGEIKTLVEEIEKHLI